MWEYAKTNKTTRGTRHAHGMNQETQKEKGSLRLCSRGCSALIHSGLGEVSLLRELWPLVLCVVVSPSVIGHCHLVFGLWSSSIEYQFVETRDHPDPVSIIRWSMARVDLANPGTKSVDECVPPAYCFIRRPKGPLRLPYSILDTRKIRDTRRPGG